VCHIASQQDVLAPVYPGRQIPHQCTIWWKLLLFWKHCSKLEKREIHFVWHFKHTCRTITEMSCLEQVKFCTHCVFNSKRFYSSVCYDAQLVEAVIDDIRCMTYRSSVWSCSMIVYVLCGSVLLTAVYLMSSFISFHQLICQNSTKSCYVRIITFYAAFIIA